MTRPFVPRRTALLGAVSLLAGSTLPATSLPVWAAGGGPWTVELFTSQGCSSCPPADKALGRLAKRPDIVALSFHVNYWDYIGWKDPFASAATTDRQRAYARALGQRSLYTPEMVFDGRAHEPGTSQQEVDDMVEAMRRRASARATPRLERAADGAIAIALDDFTLEQPADIILAVYDRRHTTPVRRGENSGATLDNFNVVRRFEKLVTWDGKAARWTVPADRVVADQGAAILVQSANHGPMVGCAKLEPAASG